MSTCEECGGQLDRPGKFGCDLDVHPKPTLAQRIAMAIEEDLNDRRGLHISSLDEEVQVKILDTWVKIIEELLR